MAFSQNTISDAGGAVSELFAGFGTLASGNIKAKGLNISAQALRLKAKGSLVEAENYDRAAVLAGENEQFTAASTLIKQHQQERNNLLQIGAQRAEIGAAGFGDTGTAIDLLRDSASQGALAKAVLAEQGAITEAGYKEQKASFESMADYGRYAASVEEQMAAQTDEIAGATKRAAQLEAIGRFSGAALKSVAAIAGI